MIDRSINSNLNARAQPVWNDQTEELVAKSMERQGNR
jgi:hypothetical protein